MPPDFTKKTIDTLARRASYLCSNPDCRARTVGPNSDPEKSVTIGEAAHICGARPGSKRYQPGMTDSARAAITNGIWLCRNCHKKVDADAETSRTDILYSWREQHEKYVLSELGSSVDRIRGEKQTAELRDFESYPPIVRRIILDKPGGWEWRLTAELLRYLNQRSLRRLRDIHNGLWLGNQEHVANDIALGWVQDRMTEMSRLIQPFANLLEPLNRSWGAPGESGCADEIHHICGLLRDSLCQVVKFEERLCCANLPEELQDTLLLLRGVVGNQVAKIAEIPKHLDEIVTIAESLGEGTTNEAPLTIEKTITLELPKGWPRRITREFRRATRRMKARDRTDGSGCLSLLSAALVVLMLCW